MTAASSISAITRIGAPAEEQLLSRPYFVRDGYFKDVSLAFHDHIYDCLMTEYGLSRVAMVSVIFNFTGEGRTRPWHRGKAVTRSTPWF